MQEAGKGIKEVAGRAVGGAGGVASTEDQIYKVRQNKQCRRKLGLCPAETTGSDAKTSHMTTKAVKF